MTELADYTKGMRQVGHTQRDVHTDTQTHRPDQNTVYCSLCVTPPVTD